jgi:hypothetical protein
MRAIEMSWASEELAVRIWEMCGAIGGWWALWKTWLGRRNRACHWRVGTERHCRGCMIFGPIHGLKPA